METFDVTTVVDENSSIFHSQTNPIQAVVLPSLLRLRDQSAVNLMDHNSSTLTVLTHMLLHGCAC